MRLISWGLRGTVLAGVWLTACNCDCKSGVVLDLPKIDPSTTGEVHVSWRHDADSEPRATCSWSAANSTNAGWSCTPAAIAAEDYGNSVRFRYEDAQPSAEWSVTLEAASGMVEKTIPSYSTDPGEGWPGQCVCYDYRASLTPTDLTSVGVRTKS